MAIVSLVLSDPIAITCCINFSARKVTKLMAIVSLVLSDPIAIACCINFSARKVTKFMAIVSLVLSDPIAITCQLQGKKSHQKMGKNEPVSLIGSIAITCCINFSARKTTKFMANVRFF